MPCRKVDIGSDLHERARIRASIGRLGAWMAFREPILCVRPGCPVRPGGLQELAGRQLNELAFRQLAGTAPSGAPGPILQHLSRRRCRATYASISVTSIQPGALMMAKGARAVSSATAAVRLLAQNIGTSPGWVGAADP